MQHGVISQVTPNSAKRPRRRWSHRMCSLELMVKSLLDLRQLDSFAQKKNCFPHGKDRLSTYSLQEQMVCIDICLTERKWQLSVFLNKEKLTSASHHLHTNLFCFVFSFFVLCSSSSWKRRELRCIGPGHTVTGCPHTHPRAFRVPTELCCTPRQTMTTRVYRAGKSLLFTYTLPKLWQWHWKEQVLFCSWFNVSLTTPVHHCFHLPVIFYISDYMVKEQDCRIQGRGIRSESQDSCSPDSACSLDYNSRESSPDHVLDGEGLLWLQE